MLVSVSFWVGLDHSDRPLLADSVEKVGLGFHDKKVRV